MKRHHDERAVERARRRTVEKTLGAQRRVISRTQALAAGMPASAIDRLVRARRWTALYRGIYTDGDPTADDVRVWAAYLWGGSGAAIGGQAALYWLGLAEHAPSVIDLYLPPSRSRGKHAGLRYRRAHIAQPDAAWKYGIFATTAARSCIDMARWKSQLDFMEVALRRSAATRDEFRATLARARQLRGYGLAARSVAEVMTSPWSLPERKLHLILGDNEITGWIANQAVATALGNKHPDVAFRQIKLAVEIEGRRYHAEAADRAAFEDGARRVQALTDAGWYVLRFTAKQIFEEPESVLRTILAVIARLTAAAAA